MDLSLLLDLAVDAGEDLPAVTDVDGTSHTRGDLRAAARAAADVFDRVGASRIGYLGTNGAVVPITLFGAAMSGRPFVPLNYRLSDEQLGDLLTRSEDMAVVAAAPDHERLTRLGARQLIDSAELLAAAQAADGEPTERLPVDPDDPAVLLFTSGTTSAPKAAILRHRHLTSYVLSTVEYAAAEPEDAVLVCVPPYHIAGVSTILTNLFGGRRIVYLDPFEPNAWLERARAEGVTHAMVVPTMLARIVEQLDEGGDDPVPSLRTLAYGGSAMPAPVIERALLCFGDVGFTNAYGLTETSSTIAVLGPDDHRAALAGESAEARARLGSAGRAVPGVELRIVDDEGRECEAGEVGEVLVRGEQVSGEYAGVASGLDDGWFHTRDRGWLDDEGYLFIEGRADDTIIRGGENIAPAEIETVLLRHPAVAECGVVGLDDPEWGQVIGAAVVLAPETEAAPDELRDWVREHLRSSKTPDVVEVLDELPYTETGKLLRRVLKESLRQG